MKVPVGLFGLAMKTTRVAGVIAASMASRSWPKFWPAPGCPRAGSLGGQRIDGESVLGEDGLALGAEEGAGDHLEHVVGAVAEHDLVDRHAVAAAQGVLQLEAVAVRVAGDVGQRRCMAARVFSPTPRGSRWRRA
jgi:hypothetical protein